MVLRNKRISRGRTGFASGPLAVIKESAKLQLAWSRFLAWYLPTEIGRRLRTDQKTKAPRDWNALRQSLSAAGMTLFDDLGPLYGKAAQIALTRATPKLREQANSLGFDRLFGDWNPLPIAAIEAILDLEIPNWRRHLTIDPTPLGVASMAQVHAAVDRSGQKLVIKVIKPRSEARLLETSAALKAFLTLLRPLAGASHSGKKLVHDFEELLAGILRESDLLAERETIRKAHQFLTKGQGPKVLKIPHTVEALSGRRVLVMERFDGPRLSDIISGKVVISDLARRTVARKLLKDLLVQIFEIGLFHGDPHGGNLILLEDGSVGIFDWGLAGELLETDRKHVAALLRASLAMDMEALLDTLVAMTEAEGRPIKREKIAKIVQKLAKNFKAKDAKPSLRRFLQLTLDAADQAKIPIPDGLLLMAKSLITIEGVAKGLDPNVMMLRVATPVLFRAARPGLQDLFKMIARLPQFLRS